MQQENPNRCKASPAQLCFMAEYIKNHASMSSGVNQSLQGRASLEASWRGLATKLNSLGGPVKTVAKWKQSWRDLKNNVKKKASHNKNEFHDCGSDSTGNGPPTIKELEVEEQVLSVMGPGAAHGVEEKVCTETIKHEENPGPSPSPAPALEDQEMGPLLAQSGMGPSSSKAPANAPTVSAAVAPSQRKRRRAVSRHDSFENQLLRIEEEKLQIKREKNAILNRLVDVLSKMIK